MSAPPIRIALVDDDPLVRAGLRMMLGAIERLEIVAEADDGSQVLGLLDRHRIDVLLLDLRMPRLDGLGVLDLLATQPRRPAIIVLTTFDTDDHVLRALRSGADGFLGKESSPEEIIRAIELVAAGEAMLSPAVTRRLLGQLTADPAARRRHGDAQARMRTLTPRLTEIAEHVAQGRSNAQIAAALHLTMATVKGHVSTILTRLDVDNRVQIALLVHDARRPD